jgi:hypothetical protein
MEGATKEFDGLYDLTKLYNVDEAPNIYSVSNGNIQYSVYVLPPDFMNTSDAPIIPVGFKLGIEKECTISVSGIDSFDPNIPIYLEDLKKGIMVNLRNQATYNFLSNPLYNQHRFLLHFAEPSSVEYEQFSELTIYAFHNQVYVKIPALAKGNAEIIDMFGKKISSFSLNQELTRHTIFQTGHYVVKLKTADHT